MKRARHGGGGHSPAEETRAEGPPANSRLRAHGVALPPLRVIIPGQPIPKARPRLGRGKRAYTPDGTRTYEFKVSLLARQARNGWENIHDRRWPMLAFYELDAHLYVRAGSRTDGDNVLKSLADGAERVLWDNDRRIRSAKYTVHRAARREDERAELTATIIESA